MAPASVVAGRLTESRLKWGDTLWDMYIGLGVFAVLAVVCVFAGAVAMKRRREYGGSDSEGEGEMGEAEFRKYEGFDK